ETVMDRLDAALGVGNWYVHVQPVTDTAARVVLGARIPTTFGDEHGGAGFIEYEDFGYATRADSPEPLKEAVSDGIRRCGRYLGIARYLYRKHDATDVAQATAQAENAKQAGGDGLIGIARVGTKQSSDGELRATPNGHVIGFRLEAMAGDRGGILVEA